MMEAQKQIHDYLSIYVNPIVSQMLVDMIKERPRNVVFILVYCKTWCQKKIDFQRTITHLDSDEDEQDFMEECVFKAKKERVNNQVRRVGVSGEIHGNFLKETKFAPKVVKKKGLIKNRIMFRLKSTFLFNDINQSDTNVLINAMEQVVKEPSEFVIKEGEEGDEIYILDEGELECSKFNKETQSNVVIKDIKEGQIFGQLSMLYNIPRTATIKAKKRSVMFKLDRKTFNFVIRRKNLLRKKVYSEVIDSIDIFQILSPQQKNKLQDIIQEMTVESNQYVIREGRVGNKLYIVLKGQLVALKKNQNGYENVVYEYKEGDYFGELSLISNKARAASIMALGAAKLLFVEREAFGRVIGSMESILQRNEQIYGKYLKFARDSQ